MSLPSSRTHGVWVPSTARLVLDPLVTAWPTLHMVTVPRRIHAGREMARNQTHRAPSWTTLTATRGWSQMNHPTKRRTHTDLRRRDGADPTRMRATSTTWSADASRARDVRTGATGTTHHEDDGHRVRLNERRTPRMDSTSTRSL